MTVPLDPRMAERLVKLCGMFGSYHDGERASAAALADRLVRENGLTWAELILPRGPAPAEPGPDPGGASLVDMADALIGHPDISEWEDNFIRSLRGMMRRGRALSKKQTGTLVDVYERVFG